MESPAAEPRALSPTPPPVLVPALAAAAAYVARQREAIEAVLARASSPSGEELHDLRVALRRAAAAAEITRGRPVGGRSGLRRADRRLRRTLSDQRTAEVSAELLAKRFARGARPQDIRLLRAVLVPGGEPTPSAGAPGEPSAPSAEALLRLGALRRAFARREAAIAIAATREGSNELMLERLFGRLDRRRLRLVRMGPPGEEELHPFRIRARDLRYGFELVAPTWPGAQPAVQALRELQEAAGDAHDLFELRRALESLAGTEPGPAAAGSAGAPHRPTRGRAAAARLLPRVAAAERRALAAARRVARTSLALLESIDLPRTAPGRVS